ncbi:predicted protein [Naegleria gruberi]|uniref:Predicted protein n=1 Tax=Naegleria gruberi TaxID=5762 RepID=D2V7N4_NAEGR|nr:uncharacterized protein NAEGRDRAFT_47330 [Naegleria gruberi]EFC47408.1 predicted protein [Naegleria gruberi]|eukprot:XP_002680152.1 predicted protein [Naegleria gruberi strain NEG-M]
MFSAKQVTASKHFKVFLYENSSIQPLSETTLKEEKPKSVHRLILDQSGITFEEFVQKLKTKSIVTDTSFKLFYLDDQNDWVSLSDEEDWKILNSILASETVIKIVCQNIVPKSETDNNDSPKDPFSEIFKNFNLHGGRRGQGHCPFGDARPQSGCPWSRGGCRRRGVLLAGSENDSKTPTTTTSTIIVEPTTNTSTSNNTTIPSTNNTNFSSTNNDMMPVSPTTGRTKRPTNNHGSRCRSPYKKDSPSKMKTTLAKAAVLKHQDSETSFGSSLYGAESFEQYTELKRVSLDSINKLGTLKNAMENGIKELSNLWEILTEMDEEQPGSLFLMDFEEDGEETTPAFSMSNSQTSSNKFLDVLVNIPSFRYLSSVDAVPLSTLTKLESNISGSIKKKLGCNFKLSKAVIYGDKRHGGLGLTSPVDVLDIECTASVCRFVNSSSTITRNIARASIQKALRGKSTDSLWTNAALNINKLNAYFNPTESGWVLCDRSSHKPITNLRNDILELKRSKKTISELGQLDSNLNWHLSTVSFWRNFHLSYYQQRLLFLNLHHAIILDNNTTCDSCQTAEDWTHVFSSCSKSNHEKQELYATWDNISSKFNLDPIRLPSDKVRNCLIIDFNGSCSRSDRLLWSKNKRLPKAVALEIYKAFAIYLENCYKNTMWYNRPSRQPFIKNSKFQSAYFRHTHSTALNLNPNHSNVAQSP